MCPTGQCTLTCLSWSYKQGVLPPCTKAIKYQNCSYLIYNHILSTREWPGIILGNLQLRFGHIPNQVTKFSFILIKTDVFSQHHWHRWCYEINTKCKSQALIGGSVACSTVQWSNILWIIVSSISPNVFLNTAINSSFTNYNNLLRAEIKLNCTTCRL